jgi:hypothetical protein
MPSGDGSNGDREHPVLPAVQNLGSRKERKGQGEKHATDVVLLASSMRNTGDSSVEAQSSGEGVRGQRVTKARGQRGESDGPEESERGKATDTRMRTAGAGPSPVRRGQQRSPVNAQAVRRWTPVALAKWAPPLHGTPWRRITGAEPGAVKAASPVLNGGDEETCRTQRALSLSNCLAPASGSR